MQCQLAAVCRFLVNFRVKQLVTLSSGVYTNWSAKYGNKKLSGP